MSFFSCRTVSIVDFESEGYERFKVGKTAFQDLPDEFYFARIMTAVCVDVVFRKFSARKEFEQIEIRSITIRDDRGNIIFEQDSACLDPNGISHVEKNHTYQLYSFKIPQEQLSSQELSQYKTHYITFSFEISGKGYSEKLKHIEKNMW